MAKQDSRQANERKNAASNGSNGDAKILTTVTTHSTAEQQVPVPDVIPIIAIPAVSFPGTVIPLNIQRDPSRKALEAALADNKLVGILSQKNAENETPGVDDIYRWGVVGFVLKLLKLPDGDQTTVVHGLLRFRVVEFLQSSPYFLARIEVRPDPKPAPNDKELHALTHNLRTLANRLIELSPNVPDEVRTIISNIPMPGALADFLAANLSIPNDQKQLLLETFDVKARIRRLAAILAGQVDMLELSSRIQTQVQDSINKTQRQYFLREQLDAIQKELGEADQRTGEIEDLVKRVKEAKMPEIVEKEAMREIDRMKKIPMASPEYSVALDYVDWLCLVPWQKSTEDNLDIARARRILNRDHYDLEKVKKRILEFLAVRKLNPTGRGPILCFVGPPGVGKTSLGRSVAAALGRKFIRMSLGGMRDEAEIRGHRRTYVGAVPGRVIQELRKCGSNNPVFMLDEVDKIGQDFRGDPASALLEVLDPEQNNSFTDHYLDVPFDLSRVMFIATANYMTPVPPALQDRMEVIEIPGYTQHDKLNIAKKYLVPKQRNENGLGDGKITFADAAIDAIIESYTNEAGVRNLERQIANVCRSVASDVAEDKAKSATITKRSLLKYLGPEKFQRETALRTKTPGVATGLAYTPAGGEIIFIEATTMPGKGGLILTGQIGDVMKESAQAAFSLMKSRADKLGINLESLANRDVHLHVPEGAVPKDGPSAGVAMFASLVSLETSTPVKPDVAVTGEITLRGLVLPIGGVKEKVLAAKRAGIHHIVLPERNKKDMVDLPTEAKKGLRFDFVENVDQALRLMLVAKSTPTKASRKPKPKS